MKSGSGRRSIWPHRMNMSHACGTFRQLAARFFPRQVGVRMTRGEDELGEWGSSYLVAGAVLAAGVGRAGGRLRYTRR